MKFTTTLARFAAALLATAAIAQATSSLREVRVNRLENGYELLLHATEAPPGAYVVVVPYSSEGTGVAQFAAVDPTSGLARAGILGLTSRYHARLYLASGAPVADYEGVLETE